MCFYFLHLKLKIQISLGLQNDEGDRWHESESPRSREPEPGCETAGTDAGSRRARWVGETCAKRVLDSCRPSSRRALQIRAHMR